MKLDERRETKDERLCHPEQSEGSMLLRVILNSPVSIGLTPRHCERSEGSLNTSLRGRSPWQSREGLN